MPHATPNKVTAASQMVHEDKELYSMLEMAELQFENKSPVSWYASQVTAALQMVHEEKELYSVTEMAELLFGNESPAS